MRTASKIAPVLVAAEPAAPACAGGRLASVAEIPSGDFMACALTSAGGARC